MFGCWGLFCYLNVRGVLLMCRPSFCCPTCFVAPPMLYPDTDQSMICGESTQCFTPGRHETIPPCSHTYLKNAAQCTTARRRRRSSAARAVQLVRRLRLPVAGRFIMVVHASVRSPLLDPPHRQVLLQSIDNRVLHFVTNPRRAKRGDLEYRSLWGGGGVSQ